MQDRLSRPMTEVKMPTRAFRRILVALDASPHSRAALGLAVRLAEDFEAELEGLFIKDENLLRAAQLPFAQEVRAHSVSPRRLDDRRIERKLRYQAERAEGALREATEEAEVTSNFRVIEGHVTRELQRAAETADLLALGKTSTQSSRRRLGTTCQALLSDAPVPVLVLRKAAQHRQPVLTYFDGSETAVTTLRVAAQLATRALGPPLKVFVPADDPAEAERLRDEVRAEYGDRVPHLQVRPLTGIELDRLAALAGREGKGLFVMPAESAPFTNAPLERFLYEIDRPLLVVR